MTLALLCDAANVSEEGKLNILGAFDTISAASFPAVHPMMRLVLRISASPAEVDRERHLTVRVLTADGEAIGEFNGDFVVPKPPLPGRSTGIQMIIDFPNTSYEQAGQYAFHILIDEDEKGAIPLTLVGTETTTGHTDES